MCGREKYGYTGVSRDVIPVRGIVRGIMYRVPKRGSYQIFDSTVDYGWGSLYAMAFHRRKSKTRPLKSLFLRPLQLFRFAFISFALVYFVRVCGSFLLGT